MIFSSLDAQPRMAVLHTLSPRDDEPVFTESNATRLLIIESTLISLVFAVVGLRCWCRHYLLRAFQLDDAFMIVALVREAWKFFWRISTPSPPPLFFFVKKKRRNFEN